MSQCRFELNVHTMRSAPFARKLRCLHICLHKELRVLSYYVCINHKNTFYSDNKWCAQRIIQVTDEKLKTKVQIEDGFIYIMN